MRKLLAVLTVILVAGVASAQYTVVDVESTQTITGDKTFSGTTTLSGAARPTALNHPASSVATMWYGAPLVSDADGPYVYMDDFFRAGYVANAATTNEQGITILQGGKFSEVADHAGFLVSVTDGDSDEAETIVVADDAKGGWLEITCNNKANDMVQAQLNGESFGATLTQDLWFEAKFEVEDVSEDTVFVGLTVADTDVLGSLGNDYMGFYLDQSTNVSFRMGKNGTQVTNAAITTLADATSTVGAQAKEFGFYVDGSASNVYVYVNGVIVATNAAAATLPNDEALSPVMAVLTTDTGADYLRVDYLKVIATR